MSPKPPDILRKSHRHAERKERATAREQLRAELDEAAQDVGRQSFAGACACGAVRYIYSTQIPPADWDIRRCTCEFCSRHDAVYTSDPAGTVEIQADTTAAIERHRFALEAADYLTCRRCGDFIAAVTPSGTDPRAVVNLRLLQDPPSLAEAKAQRPATETREQRLRRHATLWTPLLQPVARG